MHDLTLAGLYSDRLGLLHEGHLVSEGSASDVLRPETLAEFYNVSVTVHHAPDGTVVGDAEVVVFDGADLVARHLRCSEPHQRVINKAHFEGLCRDDHQCALSC